MVRRPHGRPLLVNGKRGFLGIDLLDLTPELRRHFNAGDDAGALVAHVESGSPAALAGLAVGDVLVAIDGKPVNGSWDLRKLIAPRKSGDRWASRWCATAAAASCRRRWSSAKARPRARPADGGSPAGRRDGDDTVVMIPNGKDWEEFGEEMGKFGEEMGRWGEELGAEVAEAFADPQVRLRIERELAGREQMQRKIEALERRLRDLEKRLAEQRR